MLAMKTTAVFLLSLSILLVKIAFLFLYYNCLIVIMLQAKKKGRNIQIKGVKFPTSME